MRSMKFLGVSMAYLLMALVLGWGILLSVGGNYWLLAASVVVYLIAFVKLGCLPPGTTH